MCGDRWGKDGSHSGEPAKHKTRIRLFLDLRRNMEMGTVIRVIAVITLLKPLIWIYFFVKNQGSDFEKG